jgi:hypothetical protein
LYRFLGVGRINLFLFLAELRVYLLWREFSYNDNYFISSFYQIVSESVERFFIFVRFDV